MSRAAQETNEAYRNILLRTGLVSAVAATALVASAETGIAESSDVEDTAPIATYVEAPEVAELGAGISKMSKVVVKAAVRTTEVKKAPNRGPCTSIRRGKDELYLGKACRANAKATTVDSGYPDQEWTYSAVLVGGIYKCGYIRNGILRKSSIRQDVVNYCSDAYTPLTEKRFSVYKSINCPQILGLEGCRDGAPERKLVAKRCGKAALYENFATSKRSVLNVLGKGKGGFSGEIPDKPKEEKVRWRANTKLGSKAGRAAMVRGVKTNWGFVKKQCISKDTKRGIGTITEFTPEQIERIKRNKEDWSKLKRLRTERERHINERKRSK